MAALVVLLTSLFLAAPSAAAATTTSVAAATPTTCTLTSGQRLNFTSQGVTRQYDLRLPPGGADTSTPLVMSLHPLGFTLEFQRDFSLFAPSVGGGSGASVTPTPSAPSPAATSASAPEVAETVSAFSSITRLGDREGFIAVFPQGLNNQWDLRMNGRDTGFLPALLEYLYAHGCSSPMRASVNGYSMGAMMTARLACARPDLFNGAAMVSGIYPPTPGCVVPRRMSIIGIEATGDPYIKWDGTVHSSLLQYGIQSYPYDRPTMMRKWAEAKGCANPVTGRLNLTAVTEYTGCPGSTTHLLGVSVVGHPWNIGSTSSTEYIWEVLRPLDRSPVQSGTVALHRVVGSVGATKALPISAGSTLTIDTHAVDATVIGTLTAADPTGAGHLRAYPCSAGRPNASVLNYQAGITVGTGTVVHTDSDGRFCVYTSATTHVLWDQASENALPSHVPARLLDTRTTAPLSAGAVVSLDVGTPDVTVVGTLTSVAPRGGGHLRVYPCASGLPAASALNFSKGVTIATGAVVRSDRDGRICIYSSAATDVTWDQASESALPSHAARRVVDTRAGAPLGAGEVLRVNAGTPDATVLGTIAALTPTAAGHLRIYPCSSGLPQASALNFTRGVTTSTMAAVRSDSEGMICIYASAPTHVLWDQSSCVGSFA